MAVERMGPEYREAAQQEARQRGMSVGDVVLEANLEDIHGQLYALRHRKPQLEVLEGGRA